MSSSSTRVRAWHRGKLWGWFGARPNQTLSIAKHGAAASPMLPMRSAVLPTLRRTSLSRCSRQPTTNPDPDPDLKSTPAPTLTLARTPTTQVRLKTEGCRFYEKALQLKQGDLQRLQTTDFYQLQLRLLGSGVRFAGALSEEGRTQFAAKAKEKMLELEALYKAGNSVGCSVSRPSSKPVNVAGHAGRWELAMR